MVLGVFWCFDYPKSKYDFKFFRFKKGVPSHYKPAELNADVDVEDIQGLEDKINEAAAALAIKIIKI